MRERCKGANLESAWEEAHLSIDRAKEAEGNNVKVCFRGVPELEGCRG